MSNKKRTIEWTPYYAIGVQELDQDHRTLFELVSKLILRLDAGRGVNVKVVQNQLNAYAAEHFMREELLMERYLPTWAPRSAHIQEHRSYWTKIAQMQQLSNDMLMEFLVSWWSGHVLGYDRAFGQALQQQLDEDHG